MFFLMQWSLKAELTVLNALDKTELIIPNISKPYKRFQFTEVHLLHGTIIYLLSIIILSLLSSNDNRILDLPYLSKWLLLYNFGKLTYLLCNCISS